MFGFSKKNDAPKAGSRMADKAQKPKTVMRHDPPEPSGIAFAPWSPRVSEYEVAGQLNRGDSTTRMLRSSLKLSGKGEQDLPAILVPDPDHPLDHHAVAVWVSGSHVGYMERAGSLKFHQTVADLTSRGRQVTVQARAWARAVGRDFWSGITLLLPEPDGFEALNGVPVDGLAMPPGPAATLPRDETYTDDLADFLVKYGAEGCVAVTLHETAGFAAVPPVEVRLDDRLVGMLSSVQAADLLPLVVRVTALGRVPVARAILHGNAIKPYLTLHAAGVEILGEDWAPGLDGSGAE